MKNSFLALIVLILASLACSGYWEQALPTATTIPLKATKPPLTATLCPPTANITTLMVVAEKLEIRSGPSTEYRNVGYLKYGDCVDVIGDKLPPTPKCTAGWWQIKQGYVCAEYLK